MLDVAQQFKYKRMMKEPHNYLEGRTIAMIFEKNSTRTRFSFQAGIAHLGIGYCPEERGIFSSLSCEENLMLPPRVAAEGGMSVDEIAPIAATARSARSRARICSLTTGTQHANASR